MYAVLAGTAALLELTLFFLLAGILMLHYLIAVLISYPIGVATNFFLNKYINFKNHTRHIVKQVSVFIAINIAGLFFTMLLMLLFVQGLGLWDLAARVLTLAIVFLFSFSMHRALTFRT